MDERRQGALCCNIFHPSASFKDYRAVCIFIDVSLKSLRIGKLSVTSTQNMNRVTSFYE